MVPDGAVATGEAEKLQTQNISHLICCIIEFYLTVNFPRDARGTAMARFTWPREPCASLRSCGGDAPGCNLSGPSTLSSSSWIAVVEWVALEEVGPLGFGPSSATHSERYQCWLPLL